MNWVAGVILLAVLECFVFSVLVGRARVRHGIAAPAVTGNATFDRYFRVHQNSLEQLILFVPAAWLFGAYLSALWAAIIGAVFILARIVYAISYVRAPEKRGPGAGLSFLANIVLILGALAGVVRAIVF
ncbi:MAG: MAPEG family protein [Steroidobacteraceae bacterium]